jgi:hypothetical protein
MPRKAAGPAGQSVYVFFNRPRTAEYVDASGADLTRGPMRSLSQLLHREMPMRRRA